MKPRVQSLMSQLFPYIFGWMIFSLVCWATIPEIGANLFADSITLTFGVFVIDEVRKRADADFRMPARQASLRELSRIHSELTHFINDCADSVWDIRDAKIVRAAAIGQDSRILAPLLEWVVFYEGGSYDGAKQTAGARAAMGPLARCAACSERLLTRYANEVDPAVLGAVEAVENGPFRWVRDPSFHLRRMGRDVWMPLLELEQMLRAEISNAVRSGSLETHDAPIDLLPDALRALTPGPGWTQVAIDQVEGRIPESEENRIARMRRRAGETDKRP